MSDYSNLERGIENKETFVRPSIKQVGSPSHLLVIP